MCPVPYSTTPKMLPSAFRFRSYNVFRSSLLLDNQHPVVVYRLTDIGLF